MSDQVKQHIVILLAIGIGVWCYSGSGVSCFGQDAPGAPAFEKASVPLIEQEPFDLITLDEVNGSVEIKIKPLPKPPSDPLPNSGFMVFEAPDLSDDRLQVPYNNIVSYRSYQQMLRAEATEFSRAKEYGKAFSNLVYIYDNGGRDDPKLNNDIQNLLFRDGAKNYFADNFELALAIFEDIYSRDKNFVAPGISKTPIDLILECQDRNIQANFEAGRYVQVRAALESLALRYGDDAKPSVEKWQEQMLAESNRMLVEARKIAEQGDGKRAHLTARRGNSVWPGRPESLQVFQEILQKFPIVFVGVSQTSSSANPLSLDDWGARRIGRLTERSVVEFTGPGDDGGSYEFLNGMMEQIDDNGYQFRFKIDSSQTGFAVPGLNVYELSRRMLERGSVQAKDYDIPFARIVDTIEIENENSILVKLKRAFIKPEALFQFRYEAHQDVRGNGPYQFAEKNNEITMFAANPAYEGRPNAQRPEIIEWRFPSASQAATALIAGEIDVVDRIHLADLNRLEETAGVEVASYIVPTVHMLVPNIRNEFMEDRSFRNGLLQGINRDLILQEVICGGNEVSGCELISGPFPIGTEENDQVSYAYNLSVGLQPFNDRLGMVLARVVFETRRNQLLKQGVEKPMVEFPTLTLAHPVDEVAELACSNIQRMWEAMGLKVVLRPLEIGVVRPPDEEWDFLYYQMSMEEPLTNAELLFGRNGIVKHVSAPVEQNMQKLGYADSWQNAARTLRRIHRQVVNDVTVIPLWQIQEHYAYRDNLKGIGRLPVHLYQDVKDWLIVAQGEDK